MKFVDLMKDYEEAGTARQALQAFEKDWTKSLAEQQCVFVRVDEIVSLKQGRGENWTVVYRVQEARITQPINPFLGLELLAKNLVGCPIFQRYWIINPTRIEEMVRLRLD